MDTPPKNTDSRRRILLHRLESLQQSGVMQLPRRVASAIAMAHKEPAVQFVEEQEAPRPASSVETPTHVSTPSKAVDSVQAAAGNSPRPKQSAAGDGTLFDASKETAKDGEFSEVPTLDVLQGIVSGCTRCGELAATRTQTVFGVGNARARLCFLGEAPGADEDRLGEPFVGRAGQLLTKIIEACTMKREDVYILNMIKCRPPGNRNPLPTELSNCRGYLDRQLDLIKPEFICCCGAVASQNLLNTTVSIGKLRGKVHDYRGIKVVCTYHPAFLLRSPAFKKETWEDMKFLMREIGTPID
jgi:uracil-DNA glycosylase family 4